MESLMNKYRPNTFEDVLGQETTITILKKQLETGMISNCYMFAGSSGVGKTTLARILAYNINGGVGDPININASSNNGVDDVRTIIAQAFQNPINGPYRIYIIDEAHMITTQAWNAFLTTLEEPPKSTIFMFCTTDPNKIPETIKNRLMTFNLTKVNTELIKNKLRYICSKESISIDEDSIDLIAKVSDGCVRQAIAYLEKVAAMNVNITSEVVTSTIGATKYSYLFNLVDGIVDNNAKTIISTIESQLVVNNNVNDLLDDLVGFVLELSKYLIFYKGDMCSIPTAYEDKIKYSVGICPNIEGSIKYFKQLLAALLDIKKEIKDTTIGTTILEARLININIEKECGCESL